MSVLHRSPSRSRTGFRRLRSAWLLGLLVLPAAAAVPSPYGPARLVCRFKDPAIDESSGIAPSSRRDEVFFTHNDSGDSARFFAVNWMGETLATFRVPGAGNLDWEDMAGGADEGGAPVLWFGDLGDNTAQRPSVVLYRVSEPLVDVTLTGQSRETAPAARFELVYEGGPRDAEALAIHPRTGQLYIVTKSIKGSVVFAAPNPLRPDAPNLLRKVAELNLEPLPRSVRATKDVLGSLLVTGAAISPDGSRFVIRTYTDAYEWKLDAGTMSAAVGRVPAHVILPETAQGEAIAYLRQGAGLLVSSEGAGSPVYELPRR